MTDIYVHRNQRSDMDTLNSFLPVESITATSRYWANFDVEHKSYMTPSYDNRTGELRGYQQSRRQEMQRAFDKKQLWFGRMDILLWTPPCEKCGSTNACCSKQRAVEPGPNGTLTGDVDDIPTAADREWALAESAALWALALETPCVMAWFEARAERPRRASR